MISAIDDLIVNIYRPQMPASASKKDEMIARNKEEILPKFFKVLEKRLDENVQGNGKYLIGSKLTFADLKIGGVFIAQLYIAQASEYLEWLENFPKTKAYFDHLLKVEFKSYFDRQPKRNF